MNRLASDSEEQLFFTCALVVFLDIYTYTTMRLSFYRDKKLRLSNTRTYSPSRRRRRRVFVPWRNGTRPFRTGPCRMPRTTLQSTVFLERAASAKCTGASCLARGSKSQSRLCLQEMLMQPRTLRKRSRSCRCTHTRISCKCSEGQ